jgi:signal peptidase
MPSKKFSHLLKSLFFLLSAFFLVFFLVLNLFSNSSLIGGFRTFLVQSGSMEPSINTGDVILISPQNSYHVNDVITFSDQNRKIVTHRIVEVENGSNPSYITKGDANRAIDSGQVSSKNILGKVILVIPKVGFLVAFCRTLPGLLLTIVLPAALLIYGEIKKII